jgi:hypothetical protein
LTLVVPKILKLQPNICFQKGHVLSILFFSMFSSFFGFGRLVVFCMKTCARPIQVHI